MIENGRRLADVAAAAGAELAGDGDLRIDRVTAVDDAVANSLTFAVDERWLDKALASPSAAVIAPVSLRGVDGRGKSLLFAADVRAALAAVLSLFAPPIRSGEFTHESAVIETGVQRGPGCWIGANAVVEEGASLGAGVIVSASAFVGRNARIGTRTLLHPRATVLADCIVGEDCILNAGCVIGSDGFGFVRVGVEQIKIPQIGNVVIGDRVEIGACSCVDRAVTGSTVVGSGTKIDNLVQVGHNVSIGEHCTLCGQVGIAGSAKLGTGVVAAGQAGISGHIEIGDYSLILAQAGVTHSIPARSRVSGFPAQPHRATMEQQVLLRKLPKLVEQMRALTDEVEELRKRR
ncbi:MAG TPA: UDP-3-O-(3-hydroxymyristoyl)glucosamine N-acyltransferase [Candidatus Eremiobacteraceae bacterium]|nr:UDP-3-O-(3-hydroxymyristoyl)glucosamine N-acyltransferase [Candidatus Eremiobacteraceae bacterium]